MKNLLLAFLFLPMLAFGASIPFSGVNPNQLGANPSTGQLWITSNVQLTNSTTFGSAARTNSVVITTGGAIISNASGGVTIGGGAITITNNQVAASFTINTNQFVVTNKFVGVGISSPQYDLDIASLSATTRKDVMVRNSAGMFNAAVLTDGSAAFSSSSFTDFYPGSTFAGRWTTAGRLGVNTTGPTEKFEVSGNSTVSGLSKSTNGFSSLAVDAAVDIAATGFTNNFGKLCHVVFDGTGIFYTNLNSALTPVYTNAAAIIHERLILQAGGAVRINGTGVTGRAFPL